MRPEGRRRRRTRRIPPPHTSHPRGTNAARPQAGSCPPHQYIHSVQSSHGIPAGSPPPQYIHSVQSSQQPLRLRAGGWATNERLLRPHLWDRGAPTPRGAGALTAPAPRAAFPTQSRSTHGVPIRTRQLRAPTPRRFSAGKPRMHAGESGPRRTPICPGGQVGRTHAPPSGPPQPR